MNKRFTRYLDSIGSSDIMKNRIEEILKDVRKLTGKNEDDILVSDIYDQEGNRQHVSLFIVTEFYIIESKNFLLEYNIDFVKYKRNITYAKFTIKDFDFKNSNDKSRLKLSFHFTNNSIKTNITTSRSNCLNLFNFFVKHIRPNIVAK